VQGGLPELRRGLRGNAAGFRDGRLFVHAPRLQNFMIAIYPLSGVKVGSGFAGTGHDFFRRRSGLVRRQDHQ
jgi:hypothetical protein